MHEGRYNVSTGEGRVRVIQAFLHGFMAYNVYPGYPGFYNLKNLSIISSQQNNKDFEDELLELQHFCKMHVHSQQHQSVVLQKASS